MFEVIKLNKPLRELFRIKVPFDVALLGDNQTSRRHFGTKTKRKNKVKEAAAIAWINAGRPSVDKSDLPITLNIIIRRGQRMDQHNLIGALKTPIDALFARQNAGGHFVDGLVTPDDSERYVLAGSIAQETGERFKNKEEIEFIVMTGNWR